MKIILNGKEKEVSENCTIQGLLDSLKINKNAIVVEYNQQIPDKEIYSSLSLKPDDQIELIQFLGGG